MYILYVFIYSLCPIGTHLEAINVFLDYLKIYLYITTERKSVSSIVLRKKVRIFVYYILGIFITRYFYISNNLYVLYLSL